VILALIETKALASYSQTQELLARDDVQYDNNICNITIYVRLYKQFTSNIGNSTGDLGGIAPLLKNLREKL